jgi:hypothetical protein
MLTSVLIGYEKVGRTLIVTLWPFSPRDVARVLRELPFHFAGILLRTEGDAEGVHYPRVQDLGVVGQVDGSRVSVSRKQMLALLEERDLTEVAELRFLLHKGARKIVPKSADAAAPELPTLAAPPKDAGLKDVTIVHLHRREEVEFLIPPKKSLLTKILDVVIGLGDGEKADDPKKVASLLPRVAKLRGHEALLVTWFRDRMFVRIVRRDELENHNPDALLAGEPPTYGYPKSRARDPKNWTLHRTAP